MFPVSLLYTESREDIDQRLFLGTLEKGFAVLQAFCNNPRPMTMAQVATAAGMNKSAVQRILYTLRSMGLLIHDNRTKQYRLAPRTLDLGNAYLRGNPAIESTFPFLLEANKKVRETVNLTELVDTDIMYISRVHSRDVLSSYVTIGQRFPAFATAPGRAILAHLPEDERNALLDRSGFTALTPRTRVTRPEIDAAIAEVHELGVAIAREETVLGDISIAAAILGPDGLPLAAINVAAPAARWPDAKMQEEIVPVVQDTARRLSKIFVQQHWV
ncbi:IclR family transcriptional regulator [Rhodobacteraceae bacterium PD-2]|nr:IclR family transcriptional regulator [Rhodobacteraceae bacterium PD-2]